MPIKPEDLAALMHEVEIDDPIDFADLPFAEDDLRRLAGDRFAETIAEMPKERAAERPRQEPDCVAAERRQRPGERVEGREERLVEDERRRCRVDQEIVPLDDGAEAAREHHGAHFRGCETCDRCGCGDCHGLLLLPGVLPGSGSKRRAYRMAVARLEHGESRGPREGRPPGFAPLNPGYSRTSTPLQPVHLRHEHVTPVGRQLLHRADLVHELDVAHRVLRRRGPGIVGIGDHLLHLGRA